jgi:riboflavin synthase
MFTGIVEEMGAIRDIRRGPASAILRIGADAVLEGTKIGDSIAVNGICLTVTGMDSDFFTADVMHETLRRTSLSKLSAGSRVNLERAIPADGRFGGHIVAGHVDGVGTITAIRRDDNAVWYTFRAAPGVLRYIVEKGSVTVDGISLTVAEVYADRFSISAIPHTVRQTVLQYRQKGDIVNLETDIIGKYVERLLAVGPDPAVSKSSVEFTRAGSGSYDSARSRARTDTGSSGISRQFLLENGF